MPPIALKEDKNEDEAKTGPELKMNIFNLKKVQEVKDREIPEENYLNEECKDEFINSDGIDDLA